MDSKFSIRLHQYPNRGHNTGPEIDEKERHRVDHWDLFFLYKDILLSWEIQPLSLQPQSQKVIRRKNHRTLYLQFEGELSGGRGKITAIDYGSLKLDGLSPNEISAELQGDYWQGKLKLTKYNEQPNTNQYQEDPVLFQSGETDYWDLEWVPKGCEQ